MTDKQLERGKELLNATQKPDAISAKGSWLKINTFKNLKDKLTALKKEFGKL